VGNAYTLYDTDVLETKNVVVPAGGVTTDTLTLAAPFSVDPQVSGIFAFGITTAYKLFRVLNISRSNELQFRIQAAEYNPDLYDEIDPLLSATQSLRR
jgi:hypothetical protein